MSSSSSSYSSSSLFMASFPLLSKCFPPKTEEEMEEQRNSHQTYLDLTAGLPKHEHKTITHRQYQGYWHLEVFVPSIMAAQRNIKARPGDIVLATYPKCGTTWMKALIYSVCYRKDHGDNKTNLLLSFNPHQLFASFELMYMNAMVPDLSLLSSPRLFATHLPFSQLPESVKDMPACRIVYVCRDPKDQFVSRFLFSPNPDLAPTDLAEDMDMYCSDKDAYGSIWDHMLGYWKEEEKKGKEKVMFLKYEEVKGDTSGVVKRLGEFLGFPFSDQEVSDGVVEKIVELCSFDNLSNLEVNRVGRIDAGVCTVNNKLFFRRGKVGDWRNHLKPGMAERLDAITEEKLQGSGLTFKNTTTTSLL